VTPAAHQRLSTALAEWCSWPAEISSRLRCQPTFASVLSGGISHTTYKVSDGHSSLVIRLDNPANRLLALSREHEHQYINLAAQHGITKPLLASGNDYLVTDFLTGTAWPAHSNEDQLRQLGKILRQLHNIHISDDIHMPEHGFDMRKHCQDYEQQLTQRPDNLSLFSAAAEDVFCWLQQHPSTPVLCHQDIHPDNLLLTETGILLLDWEYAAANDSYIDLASLLESLSLSTESFKVFLEAYGLTHVDWPRLKRQALVIRYVEYLWLLLQPTIDEKKVAYVSQRLHSLISDL
jgi:thiamine kinase